MRVYSGDELFEHGLGHRSTACGGFGAATAPDMEEDRRAKAGHWLATEYGVVVAYVEFE